MYLNQEIFLVRVVIYILSFMIGWQKSFNGQLILLHHISGKIETQFYRHLQ